MSRSAAPFLKSTALLVRLRLRRLANAMLVGAKPQQKPGDKARTGNPGKKRSKVILNFVALMMLFGFGTITASAIQNLHRAIDPADTFWLTVEFSAALTVGVAFLLLVLWLSSLLLTIASGDLARPDWDLEWLITLPMRSETLLWARILERSVVNPTGAFTLLPACTLIAWFSGFRWTAPIVGILAAWPLLLLAALVRTLLDTGLRLTMRAGQLRNLHALISVLSIVAMYLAISMGMKGKADFMVGVAARMPEWLVYTPMGLTVRVINERSFVDAGLVAMALLAEVGVLLWLGVGFLRHQLRNGVVAGGARESARHERRTVSATPRRSRIADLLSAVQLRELTLLGRDRNFLVQSLVVPLLIVGGQLVIGTSGVATTMWKDPNVLASVAFGLAAYSLSMSAFQTLNTEGHALWLLYTFPRSIEDVLKDKAKLWGVITLAYPLVLFAIGAAMVPALDLRFLTSMLTALLGIPIYAFIAVALGVFGSNPLEQHQQHRVKPAYVYLFMSLSGLYVYAIVTPNPAQRIVFIVLSLLLAFALWQKARDQIPYLLDPDASPPARVSTSDGLIATMLFFVVQGIVALIVGRSRLNGAIVLVAFSIGGAVTYALMRYVYVRAKTEGVPRILGSEGSRPLVGVAGGLIAATVGLVYLAVIGALGLLEDVSRDSKSFVSLGLWVIPLAVIAAPIFEEFIFRGLIYGGLRRSFGMWPAAFASAAVFAILHPALAMAPVFVLGLCTALVYERTRSLLAPMLTHAVYNACVIGIPTFFV